jgi:hypothetical protein
VPACAWEEGRLACHAGELDARCAPNAPRATAETRLLTSLLYGKTRLQLCSTNPSSLVLPGSDFPTHKDQPDKEGWGQIIAALSLGSGGHLVMKVHRPIAGCLQTVMVAISGSRRVARP